MYDIQGHLPYLKCADRMANSTDPHQTAGSTSFALAYLSEYLGELWYLKKRLLKGINA